MTEARTTGGEFFDELETRDPVRRERQQFAQARALLAALQHHTRYGRDTLGALPAAGLRDRAALATLPLLRKADIAAQQARERPFGGLTLTNPRKLFQSPGPVYEPEGPGPDPWRLARALFAAGFRAGDRVHNSFSYHLTPAGSMLESGALALGCSVLPAGVGHTELQLLAARDLACNAYTGTPSFLRILLERALEQGLPLGFIKALVSGEAFPIALRDWALAQGVQAYQCYATADCGLIAYETPARQGLVIDEGVIVEIVRPGTAVPLPEGEVGELVVTRLDATYPLFRYATGDLSALLPGRSPCGRSGQRLRGWLGRADQSAKVRGMFIHAGQVEALRVRFPDLPGRMRWVVEGEMANDRFTLLVECASPPAGMAERLQEALRDITRLRAEVQFQVELPNDGKVIDDRRVF